MPSFDPRRTALVLIDLQHGIVSMPLAPRTGEEVVAACSALADRFRDAGATVVPVHVDLGSDLELMPPGRADRPMQAPPGGLPEHWSRLVDGVERAGERVITKRHWGAFTGTELDVMLRRRGIDTVVIGGIATNFGVESTARHAWELGYHVVIAEDCCSSAAAELHRFAVSHVLPRIAQVLPAAEIGFDPA